MNPYPLLKDTPRIHRVDSKKICFNTEEYVKLKYIHNFKPCFLGRLSSLPPQLPFYKGKLLLSASQYVTQNPRSYLLANISHRIQNHICQPIYHTEPKFISASQYKTQNPRSYLPANIYTKMVPCPLLNVLTGSILCKSC